jgi:hypothetical protein
VGLLVLVALESVLSGLWGPAVSIAAGLFMFAAIVTGRIAARTALIVYAVAALIGAWQTGSEYGVLTRDVDAFRTPILMTTRTPVAGLDGVAEGTAWTYGGLYLVFRDGETLYVSRPGAGSDVWLVPASNVAALALVDGIR